MYSLPPMIDIDVKPVSLILHCNGIFSLAAIRKKNRILPIFIC